MTRGRKANPRTVQFEPEEKQLVEKWLKEQRTDSTKLVYRYGIEKFRSWYEKPLTEFLKLKLQDMRSAALDFQSDLKQRGVKQNSIISSMNALGSFCTWNGIALALRRKRLQVQIDTTSHIFNNGDLSKMFDVANVEQKAILATFTSLGWEVSAILNLGLDFIKALVERAREENQKYVYFQSQRGKTGALRLGVLNPLALEWLEKWTRDARAKGPKIFSYTTKEGVNSMLKHLARDAHITKLGRIHSHSLRKWVMSGLSRGKLNEFQIKYLMGKTIPATDMTYLQTLQLEIEENYPEIFEKFLNIRPEKIVTVLDQKKTREIEDLRRENAELKSKIAQTEERFQNIERMIQDLKKQIPET